MTTSGATNSVSLSGSALCDMDSLLRSGEPILVPQVGERPSTTMIVLEPNKDWVQRVSQGADHIRLFLNDPFLGAMYTTAPGPVVTSSSSILPAKVGGCASGDVLELEITTPGSGQVTVNRSTPNLSGPVWLLTEIRLDRI